MPRFGKIHSYARVDHVSSISQPTCNATDFKPKVEASTVCCLLLYHIIGAQLINLRMQVYGLLMTMLPAKAASQNIDITTRISS